MNWVADSFRFLSFRTAANTTVYTILCNHLNFKWKTHTHNSPAKYFLSTKFKHNCTIAEQISGRMMMIWWRVTGGSIDSSRNNTMTMRNTLHLIFIHINKEQTAFKRMNLSCKRHRYWHTHAHTHTAPNMNYILVFFSYVEWNNYY